jgi:diaminopimelate decarboxylase
LLIKTLTNLAKQLEQNGISIKEINIGGGFPSRTLKLGWAKKLLRLTSLDFGLNIPSLTEFGWKIGRKYLEETNKLKTRPVLALEPGRSLVSNAGILVTRVAVIKDNHWLFLDGSKYAVPESLFFSQGEIIIANKYNQPAKNHYHVAGSSLNTGDIFGLRLRLPQVEPRDIVAILDAGAYSISRAIQFTVLNPPIYYLRKNGKIEKIRRQGTYADTLSPSIFS